MNDLNAVLSESERNAKKVLEQTKSPTIIMDSIQSDIKRMFFSGYNHDDIKKVTGKLIALLSL